MADGYTIGEVLNQLKEDFEDITISKIRFLESERLVHPDRTRSGYRKFTDDDVDRLRFILTAQRDHYLPLKVIREQLDRLDAGEVPDAQPPPPAFPGVAGEDADETNPHAASGTQQAGALAADDLGEPPSEVEMSVRELADASGLESADVRALREFGVLGDRSDDSSLFDAGDLEAARAARELLQLGLEPRHLRMYRQFVEREVSLFEQLVTPLMRQRNPEARRQATRQLEKLSELTTCLQSALLARALRSQLHDR